MKKVTKAIIPAAGYGTRFLPQTKAMPKEMLPIVDKPLIQYVVEEAVASGIEDIIIVTGASKRAIEDHFDRNYDLENFLEKAGKTEKLNEVRAISDMANFIYISQKGPYGNAAPVLAAQHLFSPDEPVAVLWGDEFIYSKPPRLKQLINVFEKYEKSVISAVKVAKKDLSKYGIAKTKLVEDNVFEIEEIVEKPDADSAPSDLATHGAYIFTPKIFEYLEKIKPGKSGEVWLIDAIDELIKDESVYGVEVQDAKYYDGGDKISYLKAVIDFALSRAEFGQEIKEYLRKVTQEF
jgi:UTP--glucose-1-phosphate uridylyltransferase